mmetsp:Transcript_56127/g.99939  ORF Transcript_56127/g.99939 Transcript_56127/m.99939 type:complete len:296 (-) Transcript_56127:22-909(-)|eukprot:CAMPEP_0197634024 /NCGR_PEP_ID=MMETSP1338-20131121/10243_1 /TAXON_ID=43686 ORGANISM="Pelagodinium beii, Strain RCC1491" /NCGR_SAMPLE_ID=MMETSP1338 /ASSEMBLY_ACC=CAM_ASM_000754 /LENGTH=295 /DNA_ID=CAMNT_0043205815 /DNA_START=88 /DNA_END=975 /DNA_ORIENTATION=-
MTQLRPALLLVLALVTLPSILGQDDDEMDEVDEDETDKGDEDEVQPLGPETLHSLFQKFDKNRDSKVTLQEILAFSQSLATAIAEKDAQPILEGMDVNADGKLSLEELLRDVEGQSSRPGEADAWDEKEMEKQMGYETAKFKAADQNGDMLLDSQEVAALFYPESSPAVLEIASKADKEMKDKDGDGYVSLKEWYEMDDMTPDDEQDEEFKDLDKDGNGLLDTAELERWWSGVFHTESHMMELLKISDKDGDNAVTLKELENAAEEIMHTDSHYRLVEWAEHLPEFNEWAQRHDL